MDAEPRPTAPATGLRILLAVAAMAATLAAYPGVALGDTCGTPLLSTCIDDDNVWAHPGSSRFMSLGGTETAPHGEVGFGLHTTYLSRPIVLTTIAGGGSATDNVVDDQIDTAFLFNYGVSDRLELDVALPVTLTQTGTGPSPLTGSSSRLGSTGARDLRFGFAYALLRRPRVDPDGRPPSWGLAGRLEVAAPTGDGANFASNGHAVWAPGLTADYRAGRGFAGAEIGLRLRGTEDLQGARIGSQALVGVGAGYDVLRHELLSVVAEAFALPTFSEQHAITASAAGTVSTPDGKYIAPAEWMLSVRSAPLFGGDFQVQVGGGGPIPFASQAPITDPRFRFSLSVRYAPTGRDTDGDGVLDRDDRCPLVPGVAGNPAGEGCPPSAELERLDLSAPPATSSTPP